MLSKPLHGWSEFSIGGLKRYVSYLTDVPFECLTMFIEGLSNNKPISIYFDEEGSSFILLSTKNKAYIVLDNDDDWSFSTIEYNVSMLDLAKQLLNDILACPKEWANWFDYDIVESEKYIKQREVELKMLCVQLQELIEEEEQKIVKKYNNVRKIAKFYEKKNRE